MKNLIEILRVLDKPLIVSDWKHPDGEVAPLTGQKGLFAKIIHEAMKGKYVSKPAWKNKANDLTIELVPVVESEMATPETNTSFLLTYFIDNGYIVSEGFVTPELAALKFS
jgi:hypothetical protein